MVDFDRVIDRRGTCDLKYRTSLVKHFVGVDVSEEMIPMWVADMDFACPQCIQDAVKKRADREIYGYCLPDEKFFPTIANWYKTQHSWAIPEEWLIQGPSVLTLLNLLIRFHSQPGDSVIIQQPVYKPFCDQINFTRRKIVNNALIKGEDRYQMDFDLLERQAAQSTTKVMLLCSPHNPVGRVWTKEELRRVAEICSRNGVFLISDEIHCDLIHEGYTHTPFGTQAGEEGYALLFSPGKSFNISGLKMSFAIIPDSKLREKVTTYMTEHVMDTGNTFGYEAVVAGYSQEGAAWLKELMRYVGSNVEYIKSFVAEKMPEVKVYQPEGTYVIWLDFGKTGWSDEKLLQKIVIEKEIITDPGPWFGQGGEGCMRLNLACPQRTVRLAMDRIYDALYRQKTGGNGK